jgi:DNA-binding HxlR family transcriptional regulator
MLGGVKSYGQFCSIARALDLLGERWTLLVVRELLCGSRRFGDIQRGVPRISRTMLSARLRELVAAGVIARDASGAAYDLTAAGQELAPIVEQLGVWGQRWLPRHLDEEELDVDALVWDMRRRVDREALPARPVVVRVELSDVPARRGRRFLLLRRSEVSLCAQNPGFPEELVVRSDRRTLAAWWRGDVTLAAARRGGLAVEGPRALVAQFPRWFERYALAEVAPAPGAAG